jgi:uncharacterized damage-inducible protein DinB
MIIQDLVVLVSREAGAEFFRYAKAVPVERLEWEPLETGQSVLSMCREIVQTPEWASDVLNDISRTDAERQDRALKAKGWSTVEACEREFDSRFEQWALVVSNMPDQKLAESKWLPFNGGREHTYLELLDYVRWNCAYHTGQVAYIQTLFGDKAMY